MSGSSSHPARNKKPVLIQLDGNYRLYRQHILLLIARTDTVVGIQLQRHAYHIGNEVVCLLRQVGIGSLTGIRKRQCCVRKKQDNTDCLQAFFLQYVHYLPPAITVLASFFYHLTLAPSQGMAED